MNRELSKKKTRSASNSLNEVNIGDELYITSQPKTKLNKSLKASATQAFTEFQSASISRYGRTRKRKTDDDFYHGTMNFKVLREIACSSSRNNSGSPKTIALARHSRPKLENVSVSVLKSKSPIGCRLDKIWDDDSSEMEWEKVTLDDFPSGTEGECYKAFTGVSTLKNNIKIHSRDNSYQCRKCEKFFLLNKHLIDHMKTHMREKSNQSSQYDNMSIPTFIEKAQITHTKVNDMFRINHKNYLTKNKLCNSERQLMKTRTLAEPEIDIVSETVKTNNSCLATTPKPIFNNLMKNREHNATIITKSRASIDKLQTKLKLKTKRIDLTYNILDSIFSKVQSERNIAKESIICSSTNTVEAKGPHVGQKIKRGNLIDNKLEVKEERKDYAQYENRVLNQTKVKIKNEQICFGECDYNCSIKPKVEETEDPINIENFYINDWNYIEVARVEDELVCEKNVTDIWNETKIELIDDVIDLKTHLFAEIEIHADHKNKSDNQNDCEEYDTNVFNDNKS